MLSGRDIVCFSTDWSGDPTSKKHIMSRLARDNRVLWIDSIGYRNPRPSARDLRRLIDKAGAFCRGCRRVAPNLWTLSPPALPFHANPAARRVNRRLLGASLRRAVRRLGLRDLISWAFLPNAGLVAGSLGERLLVYHCVDEFSQFTGVDAASLGALEAELAARADLVFVSAERLLETKQRHNPNTFLVRHGVEVEHFGRALEPSTQVPDDLGRGSRPVIGFFGLVADWVDLDLVRFVALARPRWTLALIGQVETDPAPVAGLENVRILGRRSYADLPRYCKGFDVAILPFKVNELTIAANPLKLREYLAAGLPVVSTAIPEAEQLAPLVRVGRSPESFLAEVDAIVASGATGPRREIAAKMQGESWDHKTEELSEIVGRFLARREAGDRVRAFPRRGRP